MNSKLRAVFVILLVGLSLWFMMNKSEALLSDEVWFWKQGIVQYMNGEVGARDNVLPQTPLFIVWFGTLGKILGLTLLNVRTINLVYFLVILFALLWTAKDEKNFYKGLLILAIIPYMLFLATSAYTDMLFMMLLLFGFIFHDKKNYPGSFIFFTLAIATRQFGIVFPLALAMINLKHQDKRRWIYPLASVCTLAFWFVFFGFSLTPTGNDDGNFGFNLFSGIMFLAVYGAYYKIPEIMMFGRKEENIIKHLTRWAIIFGVGLAIVVALMIYHPEGSVILKGQHWFYWLYNSPFILAMVGIGILASMGMLLTRTKFELWVVILSACMFCFVSFFFDKYVAPLALIMVYQMIKKDES